MALEKRIHRPPGETRERRPNGGAARRRARRSAGAALAEFGLIVGVVLTLLLGIMEFGEALYTYHFVANAARQASRYAIVRGAACTGWATACPASADDIQNYVRTITPTGIDPNGVTVTTAWLPNNTPGSEVNVTVQYNFDLDIPFVPSSLVPMKSASQMVISQ